jgi:hypothetical protein
MTNTILTDELNKILLKYKDLPVYAKSAYNYHRIKRVVHHGEFVVIETYEENSIVGLDEK